MRTDNDNNNKNERNIKADRNKVMRPRKKGLFYFPRFLLQGYKKNLCVFNMCAHLRLI